MKTFFFSTIQMTILVAVAYLCVGVLAAPVDPPTNEPVSFRLKQIDGQGPAVCLIDSKLKTNDNNSAGDDKCLFQMRPDKTVWIDQKQLIFSGGEFQTKKMEYRNQNDANHDRKAQEQKFHFELRPCGNNKMCLADSNYEVMK